jgi:Flp pilus assembly protein TadD
MLKALKLEENNIEAMQQIGLSLAAKNQKDSAKQYLLKASSLRLASGQIEEYKKLLAIISSLDKR